MTMLFEAKPQRFLMVYRWDGKGVAKILIMCIHGARFTLLLGHTTEAPTSLQNNICIPQEWCIYCVIPGLWKGI